MQFLFPLHNPSRAPLRLWAFWCLALVTLPRLLAQTTPSPIPLRVYLDFFNPPENTTYLRTAVRFVDFTAKPADADVRVQYTRFSPGNGSYLYTLYFFGEGRFKDQNDTAICMIPPLLTSQAREDQLVQTFKEGLLPYLLRTEWAERLQFDVDETRLERPFGSDWHRSTWLLSSNGTYTNNKTWQNDDRANDVSNGQWTLFNRAAWFHIERKWRANGNFTWQYSRNKRTGANPSVTPVYTESQVFSGSLGFVHQLKGRLSAGLGLNGFTDRQLSGVNNRNLTPSIGLEYNLFSYDDFFRRYFLVNYFFSKNINNAGSNNFSNRAMHVLGAQFGWRGKRIFTESSLSGGLRFNPEYWNLWHLSANIRVGFEVRRNLFLTPTFIWAADNSRSLGEVVPGQNGVYTNRSRFQYISARLGVVYLFGSGYRNILNPALPNLNIPRPAFF